MNEELRVNLAELICSLISRIWLIILGTVVFAAAAFLYTEATYSPLYVATTSFVVNVKQNGSYPANRPTASDIMLAQELVDTYTLVLKSNLVMNAVIDMLDLKIGPRQLASTIKLSSAANTQILYLEVTYPDSKLAVDIARAITDIAPYFMMETVEIGSINVLDKARLTGVVPKGTIQISIAAGFVGFVLSVLLTIILKVTKARLICPEAIEMKLGLRCLFELEHLKRGKRKSSLLLTSGCNERIAEQYIKMGLFVKRALDSGKMKKLLVTSMREGEGKTMVAVNLALSLSRLGHQVVLIDGNLKKPSLMNVFSIARNQADCFDPDLEEAKQVNYLARITPNFYVMPFIKSSIGRVNFKSESFGHIIEVMQEFFDYIIFDSAPATSVDTLNLAEISDGVLMVVKQNETRVGGALMSLSGLNVVGTPVIGCVLNGVKYKKITALSKANAAGAGNYPYPPHMKEATEYLGLLSNS